ncbi:MAG: VanZ family protein [Acidobacteriota bacterium]
MTQNGILDLRRVRTLTLIFGLFILWVIYQANTHPSNLLIAIVQTIPFGDKVGHAVLYGLLTLGVNASSRFRTVRFGSLECYLGTLAVTVFAGVEELSQITIPSRTWDSSDLVADAVGIAGFTVLSALWEQRSRR